MRLLDTPLTGPWPLPDFPPAVELGGRRFLLARWRQGKAGVVAQYREDVPFASQHLCVHANGWWSVSHTDWFNPDAGRPLRHFLTDHPIGRGLLGVTLVSLGVALGIGIVRAMEEEEKPDDAA